MITTTTTLNFDLNIFPEGSPWSRCMTSWMQSLYRKSQSKSTPKTYAGVIRAFFTDSAKAPEMYSREDVENFLHRLTHGRRSSGKPPTNGAINYRLAVLNSFYTFAATYTVEGPDGKPEPLLKRPSPTIGITPGKPARVYKAMSGEEVRAFFAVIPRDTVQGLRDRAIFLCFFWTLRRMQEIARLRWGDIEQSVIVEKDGTRREAFIYRWYGKGHSTEEDAAELPALAKAAIDEYLIASGRMDSMRPDSPLFVQCPRPSGWLPAGYEKMCLTGTSIHRYFKQYAREAGLDAKRLSVHSFRHTGARIRFEEGADLREIQNLLRHRSLAVTDTYLSILMGTADPGAKRLEAKFAGL